MSSFGEMFRAFGGDDTFSVLKNTKSPQIEAYLQRLFTSEDKTSGANDASIDNFVKKWMADQGKQKARANQEISYLDQFYDGTLDRTLADMRSRRKMAVRDASDRGIAEINRNRSIGFLGGDSPNNSYLNRIAAGLSQGALINAALDDSNQERTDLGWLTGNRVSLAGKRGALSDSVLGRILFPNQLRSAEMSRKLGTLGGLNQIEKSNTFYGLQKDRDALDQVSDFFNALGQTVMDAGSLYGGMAGMGGGGGGGDKKVRRENTNIWGSGLSGGNGAVDVGGGYVPFQYSPGIDASPSRFNSDFGGLG